jgi:hypothetical protein
MKQGYLCKVCGDSNPDNFYGRQRSLCKKDRNTHNGLRLKSYKKQLVEYKGNKCQICGYNKSIAALQFHHRDRTQKDPNYLKMKNWSFERRKTEIDKCDLICANCHAEIHEQIKDY